MKETHSSGIFFRISDLLPQGEGTTLHAHNFDHETFAMNGRIRVETLSAGPPDDDGYPVSFEVLERIDLDSKGDVPRALIKAGVWHRITALSRNARYCCVFVPRDEEGNITKEHTGWPDAFN